MIVAGQCDLTSLMGAARDEDISRDDSLIITEASVSQATRLGVLPLSLYRIIALVASIITGSMIWKTACSF